MIAKEKLQIRIGRIPIGYAAYEAEAIEYDRPESAVETDMGHVALTAILEPIESEAS